MTNADHASLHSFRALLRSIEYDSATDRCPVCGRGRGSGHEFDCELARHIRYCEERMTDRPGEVDAP